MDRGCGGGSRHHGRRGHDRQPLALGHLARRSTGGFAPSVLKSSLFQRLLGQRRFFLPLHFVVTAALLLSLVGAATVSGQDLAEVEPGSDARFRVGALRFTPSLLVSNVGVDSNVFNEAENPQSDRTAAVGPAVNLWLRMGRARLSAQASGQYLYFQEFSTQRAWNTANTARIELPLARFMPFASGSFANTRQRAGFEIDSRARMRAGGASLGSSVRLSGKTSLVLTASQNQIRFDRDETFLGESLANALDRSTTAEQLDVRFNLTPLTTFVLTSEALQDRFDVSDDRNADSIRIMPGFEMKPLALISGRAAVGIRHFNVLSNRTPDFTGLVANVSASSSIAATKLEARWARDITYSYQVEEPYYALNDFGFIVTQRITAGWDVVARTGWQALHYRRNIDAVAAIPRTDRAALYGGGIGYLLGQGIRLGFDVNYYRRNSDALGFRNFEGLRMGASVGYGLTQ